MGESGSNPSPSPLFTPSPKAGFRLELGKKALWVGVSVQGLPWDQGSTRGVASSYTPIPEESRVPPFPGNNITTSPTRERDPVPGTGLGSLFTAIQCPPSRQALRLQTRAQRAEVSSLEHPGKGWPAPLGSASMGSDRRWAGHPCVPPSLSIPGEPSSKDWGPRV